MTTKGTGVRPVLAKAKLKAMADLFDEALTYCRADSVAILGIVGDNGLNRIDPRVTQPVIGIDIHPSYLHAVRRRHPQLPLTFALHRLGAPEGQRRTRGASSCRTDIRARWHWTMSSKRHFPCCTRR